MEAFVLAFRMSVPRNQSIILWKARLYLLILRQSILKFRLPSIYFYDQQIHQSQLLKTKQSQHSMQLCSVLQGNTYQSQPQKEPQHVVETSRSTSSQTILRDK